MEVNALSIPTPAVVDATHARTNHDAQMRLQDEELNLAA